jgi:RNA polymerase sigma-70 factor, ECF subfamily
MNEDDSQLVESALTGDTSAFGRLYDRYAPLVRAVCFEATGGVTEAQDLAQEVFLSAYRRLRTLREPAKFGTWILGIARLSGRQWRRTRARDRHRFVGEHSSEPCSPSAGLTDDDAEELRVALGKLDEAERLAVHLFYLEEQPAGQVQRVLGLSLSGFYRVLERARRKIFEQLQARKEVQS